MQKKIRGQRAEKKLATRGEDVLLRWEHLPRLPIRGLRWACLHAGLGDLPGRDQVLEELGVGPVVFGGRIKDALGGLVGVSNVAAHLGLEVLMGTVWIVWEARE